MIVDLLVYYIRIQAYWKKMCLWHVQYVSLRGRLYIVFNYKQKTFYAFWPLLHSITEVLYSVVDNCILGT